MPELITRLATAVVATTIVSAIALPQIVRAFDGTDGRIIVAEQQDPKKKKEAPPQKGPPPQKQNQQQQQQQKVQQQGGQPKVQQGGQPKMQEQGGQPKMQQQGGQPKMQQQGGQPKMQQQGGQPKTFQKAEPRTVEPKQKSGPKQFDQKKDIGERKFGPKQDQQKAVDQPKLDPKLEQQKAVDQPKFGPKSKTVDQPKFGPQTDPKAVQKAGPKQFDQKKDVQTSQPKVAPRLEPQTFGQPKIEQKGARVGNVNELKGKRQEERKGNQVFIREPGNRTIIRENNRIVIRHDESERMRRSGNARFEVRGQERFTTVRRGGYDVVTITDNNGRLLRRFRRGPDGREYVLIDNRRRYGVGAAVVGGVILLGLAAPVIAMPRERYIVDMGTAPPGYIYEALEAPPVMALERPYTLDEIRDNLELRDRVRSVDINTINFSTGSWEVSPDQVQQLQALADAMQKVISENSSTVFLLEGHTDAVGSAEDNLSLSDRRAESVAEILTSNFNIPPENLVTQGYGEQNLRVQTDGPSRENRRVQVRNITGLMAGGEGGPDSGPQGGEPPPGGPPPG